MIIKLFIHHLKTYKYKQKINYNNFNKYIK